MSKDPWDPRKQPVPHDNMEHEKPCNLCSSVTGEEILPSSKEWETSVSHGHLHPQLLTTACHGCCTRKKVSIPLLCPCPKLPDTLSQPLHWEKHFHPESCSCRVWSLWFEHHYQCIGLFSFLSSSWGQRDELRDWFSSAVQDFDVAWKLNDSETPRFFWSCLSSYEAECSNSTLLFTFLSISESSLKFVAGAKLNAKSNIWQYLGHTVG